MENSPVDVNGPKIAESIISMDSLELLKIFKAKGTFIRSNNSTMEACTIGNSEILKFILDNHAKSESQHGSESIPLIAAVQSNNQESVKILLERGVDPNVSDAKGSALIHACENPTLEIVKLLIEYGAFVNVTNNDKDTPILIASQHGYLDIVKFLIDAGAEYDYTPSLQNPSPLTAACKGGRLDVVKYLISIGCDPNEANEAESLPVSVAIEYQHSDVADYIIQSTQHETELLSQLLFTAVSKRDINSIKAIAKKKISFGTVDKQKRIATHYAADTNREILEFLLSLGSNINAKDSKGFTPLHVAVGKNNYECAKVLIEKGADINAKSSYGFTPLRIAAQNKYFSITELLISKGADIDIPDNSGNTPLASLCNLTASSERSDMIKLLINAGANSNFPNKYNMSPLRLLILKKPKIEELHALIKSNAMINTMSVSGIPTMFDASKGSLHCFSYLLSNGGNVNTVCKNGNTCLHAAAGANNIEIAETLLGLGLNINAKDNKQRTPIFCAVIAQAMPMVEFLLKKGANINDVDDDGNTVLITAMKSEKPPTLSFVQFIASKGLDLKKKNKQHESVKSIANRKGLSDISNFCSGENKERKKQGKSPKAK